HKELQQAKAEADRLKAELEAKPPPGPDPYVILPSDDEPSTRVRARTTVVEPPPPPKPVITKPGKGLDVGTVNLVAAAQNAEYKTSHILEGHAVTFAELGDEDFTGIGISCGGGMFNVCVAYKSMPALSFSSSRSGDWVDMNVAQVLGIKPEKAAMLKEQGVDLVAPKNREEDAIAIYYRNLIQYN